MIYIKIYGKGHGKTHTYVKADCPGQHMAAQLTALLMTTCQIARNATTEPDKDKFLQMMGVAWDVEAKRSESET